MNSPPRERTVSHLQGVMRSPALWCAIAAVDFLLTSSLRPLLNTVGDPDDAVRLESVRELLHGASWFDTTLPRIGAPAPLVSHWSRLVDAPLAVLIGGLTPLLGVERAELTTRILWPTLLFFVLLLIVARE